jgi:hypothetical protein
MEKTGKRKGNFVSFILIVLGIFCLVYLISTGGELKQIIGGEKRARTIRVEVLNGTDINGLAKLVAERLKKRGFDVIEVGNAKEKLKRTVILDRKKQGCENARFVRRWVGRGEVQYFPDPSLIMDVSVILGEDFQKQ